MAEESFVKEKYCPTLKRNVAVRVTHGKEVKQTCLEQCKDCGKCPVKN